MRYIAAMLAGLILSGCQTSEPAAEQPAPAPGQEASNLEPGDADAGRAFARKNCSTCHAVGAKGASPYAPAPPLRTLHEKYDVEGLAEAFAEGILVGHKGPKQMPEFVLTPEEIDDLLAYLKSFE